MKQGDSTPHRVKHVRRCDWCVNIAFAGGVLWLGFLLGARVMLMWLVRGMFLSTVVMLVVGLAGLVIGQIHKGRRAREVKALPQSKP